MSKNSSEPAASNADAIPSTVRAAVYRGKNDVHVETIPVPEIGSGEVSGQVVRMVHHFTLASSARRRPVKGSPSL